MGVGARDDGGLAPFLLCTRSRRPSIGPRCTLRAIFGARPGSVEAQEPLSLKPSLLGTTHVTDHEAALGYRRHPREADAQVLLRHPVTHGFGEQAHRPLHELDRDPLARATVISVVVAALWGMKSKALPSHCRNRSGLKVSGSPHILASWLVPYRSSSAQVPSAKRRPLQSNSSRTRPATKGKNG